MKLQHLDSVCLAQILGREPVTTLMVVPDLALEIMNGIFNQVLEILVSADPDMTKVESLLVELDATTRVFDSYRNICTRDQFDEMIHFGLLDPQDVEQVDLAGAVYEDICRKYGRSRELRHFVFCTHSFDNIEVVIRAGIGSVQSDTDFIRELLASGQRDRAVDFLVEVVQF